MHSPDEERLLTNRIKESMEAICDRFLPRLFSFPDSSIINNMFEHFSSVANDLTKSTGVRFLNNAAKRIDDERLGLAFVFYTEFYLPSSEELRCVYAARRIEQA